MSAGGVLMAADEVVWGATRQLANSPPSDGAHWQTPLSFTVAGPGGRRGASPKSHANPKRGEDNNNRAAPRGVREAWGARPRRAGRAPRLRRRLPPASRADP